MRFSSFLLIIFFLSSCAISQSTHREVASKGLPARIVKVLSPEKNSFVYEKNLKIPIKIQAFKFGKLAAVQRKVEFSLKEGSAKFFNKDNYTDKEGKASALISVSHYPAHISLKIRVDNVIKNLELDIVKPKKFIGNYSLSNSSFKADKQQTIANGINIINFKIQLKDSNSHNIDAYGFSVKLHLAEKTFSMKELGGGVYEYDYQVGTKKGIQIFGVSVEGKMLKEKLQVKLLPDLIFESRFFLARKNKQGEYEVEFALKERTGNFITSLENIDIYPLLNGKGTYSKITYDKKINRFHYFFFPPEQKGSTTVGVHFAGKDYWAKNSFGYDYNDIDSSQIELILSQKRIIPTGIDFLPFSVKLKNKRGELVKVTNPSQFPEVRSSLGGKVIHFKQDEQGLFHGELVPRVAQKEEVLEVLYQGKIVKEKTIKFNMSPLNDKISLKRQQSSYRYFEGMNYGVVNSGSDWKEVTGQVVSFKLENSGINNIIPRGCAADVDDSNKCQSSREFEFEFIEQARQNMAMIVTDYPSDTLSKMMHGWFLFFPRKVIPYVYWSEDKTEIHVVLPTNEEVVFDAQTKEIIGGVLEEGAIDLSPSRHSRKFPLVRYKGKGVVLRINARGQDARLGNWNKTKISGDFGNTGAEGVMIYKYNEDTGQAELCRAKKSEFWPQEDINPIPFKYFSDKDFAAYVKSHCSFELSLD